MTRNVAVICEQCQQQVTEGICSNCATEATQYWEQQQTALVRQLADLTPGGSEFANNPRNCLAWIKRELESSLRIAVEKSAEANKLRERVAVLEQVNKVMDGQFQAASRQADLMGDCFRRATEEKTELRERIAELEQANRELEESLEESRHLAMERSERE